MSEAGELGFEPGDQPAQANHNSTQLGGRHDTQIDTGEAVEGLFNGYQHRMGHASKVANSNVADASDTGQGIGTFDPGVASQAGGTYDS